MKLVKLARAYASAARKSLNLIWGRHRHKEVTKLLYSTLPNYVYLETAYKNAKAIVENIRFYKESFGKDKVLADIRRFWVTSHGNKWDKRNRNIKLTSRDTYFEVQLSILGMAHGLRLKHSSEKNTFRYLRS